jgi:FkbM family methyltransferase
MDATVKYAGYDVTFYDVNPDDFIGKRLLAGDWYELPNLQYIHDLNVSGNYVDIGSYIGTHAVYFAKFCKSDRVFAFEPTPDIYKKLCRNIEANCLLNCKAFNLGISNEPGRGLTRGSETNKGASWILPGDEFDVVTLDSLNLPEIKLMKIDVEGMELKVLHGAINTLKNVDHLFIEMWTKEQAKGNGAEYTKDKVIEFLESLGFKLNKELLEECLYHFRRG